MITVDDGILLIEGVPFGDAALEIRDEDLSQTLSQNMASILETPSPTFKVRVATLRFETGWTLVVSWGNGNHCSNHTRGISSDLPFLEESPDAELCAYDVDGRWWDFEEGHPVDDDCPIMPYVLSKDVLSHAMRFTGGLQFTDA